MPLFRDLSEENLGKIDEINKIVSFMESKHDIRDQLLRLSFYACFQRSLCYESSVTS